MKQTFSYSGTSLVIPNAYRWVVDKGLLDFEGRSPLEPWHLLEDEHCRSLHQIWPGGPNFRDLVAFAKRQDNDDYACFELDDQGRVIGVVVVHGWTTSGYDVDGRFGSIWEWLKYVIDEVRRWQEMIDNLE